MQRDGVWCSWSVIKEKFTCITSRLCPPTERDSTDLNMVRLVGPALVSNPLFYLSEINNYRFSSTPFFLISEDKLILAGFKETGPRH